MVQRSKRLPDLFALPVTEKREQGSSEDVGHPSRLVLEYQDVAPTQIGRGVLLRS